MIQKYNKIKKTYSQLKISFRKISVKGVVQKQLIMCDVEHVTALN